MRASSPPILFEHTFIEDTLVSGTVSGIGSTSEKHRNRLHGSEGNSFSVRKLLHNLTRYFSKENGKHGSLEGVSLHGGARESRSTGRRHPLVCGPFIFRVSSAAFFSDLRFCPVILLL